MPISTRYSRTSEHLNSIPYYARNCGISLGIFFAALILTKAPSYFDRPIAHLVNGLAQRNAFIDLFFLDLDDSFSLSGGVIMALLWGSWFAGDAKIRARMLVATLASFVAGVISRRLQYILPTHFRPFYDPTLHFRVPLFISRTPLNTWHSFPSDHMAVFAGLLMAVWIGKSKFRYIATVWVIIVESARIYEGAHYPSDLIGGAALASTLVWASQSPPMIAFAGRFLRFERSNPAFFYTCAFFISFQLATLFMDVRNIGGGFLSIARHHGETISAPSADNASAMMKEPVPSS